jgi:PAS domain S-box-containing protein
MGDPALLDKLETARRAFVRDARNAKGVVLRPLLDTLDRTLEALRSAAPGHRNAATNDVAEPAAPTGLLLALLESTTDIIFAKDLQGRYLMINEAGARAIGRPVSEVIGRNARELLSPEMADRILEADTNVLEAADTRTLENLANVEGESRVYLSTKGVLRDRAGVVTGLFGIARDITDRKRREQEHAELLRSEQIARENAERAARALGDLLAVTEAALSRLDLHELLDSVAVKVEAVFRADTVAILLRSEDDDVLVVSAARGIVDDDEIGSHVPFSGTVARQVMERESPLRVEDLSQVEVSPPGLKAAGIRSLLLAPMRLGDRAAGVLHVGTLEPGRFDDNDARLLQLVADRVAQAVEHARLFEASQRAIRARDEMLAVISHDLGNPLNGIVLNANLLDRRLDRDDQRPHSYVDRIRRDADRMHHMVLDLLDTASLDAGSLALDRGLWPAESLLTEAVDILAPLADDRSIQLESASCEPGLVVDCDRQRTLRVFSNLIGNAIKFTPEQGRVCVSAARDGAHVRFTVEDTGPGIAPEHIGSVFSRYWQAPGGQRRGRGLGLYIAKGIVEAHGGAIWIDRADGGGARFSFTLPAEPER